MKEHPVKCLIDSDATGNFISDHIVTALKLKIVPYAQDSTLQLADGS